MAENPKSKSTQPRYLTTTVTLYISLSLSPLRPESPTFIAAHPATAYSRDNPNEYGRGLVAATKIARMQPQRYANFQREREREREKESELAYFA